MFILCKYYTFMDISKRIVVRVGLIEEIKNYTFPSKIYTKKKKKNQKYFN